MKFLHHLTMGLPYIPILRFLMFFVPLYLVHCQEDPEGYRLTTSQEFLVMAPKTVRPEMVYEMRVSLFKLLYPEMTVRAILSLDGEEYASGSVLFRDSGTKSLQVMIPLSIGPGKHLLVVEGHVGVIGQPVFHNETLLNFETKYVSLFIQPDKPVYFPGQPVYFRIIGVYPGSLRPASGGMTIYVKDSKGNIVRRWIQMQLNVGMYSGSFDLAYPVNIGLWAIEVDAFGHRYSQEFKVDFYYKRVFEVNVTTPMQIFDTEWGVAGQIYGEHIDSGKAASGNFTVECRLMEENGDLSENFLSYSRYYMEGTAIFEFSMNQIVEEFGPVVGKMLHFKGWIFDWYWFEPQNGTSVTRVLRDGVEVQRLGRRLRTFKPMTPFQVQFAVQRTDGTRYTGYFNRQIHIQRTHEGIGARTYPEERVPIPDDNIVTMDIFPEEDDQKITISAWHPEHGGVVEIWAYRYFSKTEKYITISSSTEKPMTNEYMIFTIRLNFIVPEVNYLIASGGRILLGSTVIMNHAMQKTFSVAISREMAPQARIIVYAVSGGDVLLDSFIFYVRDTLLTSASLSINYGKDFIQNTIEVIGRGYPGGFLGLNGLDYEWYRRGAAQWTSLLTKHRVVRELLTYEYPNEAPYHHSWNLNNEKWEETVFYARNTHGMDTLSTLDASGIVALSDMNMTAKQEFSPCNRTLGFGLCPNGQCYDLTKECDGVLDCLDGYDEIICPSGVTYAARPPDIDYLSDMNRYYQEGDWVWKTSYVRFNGQIEVKLDVPKATNPTVIGGFILHPSLGFQIAEEPCQHDTTRRFFMMAEAPSLLRRGEQLGIRLAIYNNWEQDMEVIVMLHGGEDFRFVNVEEFGIVNSYTPRLTSGDVQTMVLMRAGEQRYVFMPIVAIIETGELEITISALSFLDRDDVEVVIELDFDGVDCDDHNPYLIDLINQGSILIPHFQIPMPERWLVPEQRDHLYVPGSNGITADIYGEVVLPGFFEDHLTLDDTAGVPHHSAEGYLHDYAINLLTMKYLHAVNMLEQENIDNAAEYMISVLARQYAYMQDDGSFKMYRRTDKPCLWVTAHILKYLHATVVTHWAEIIFIPTPTLNKIALWIIEQQNMTTGAFTETSDEFYDRNFWPESVDMDGNTHIWHIPITAQVVITLGLATRLTNTAKSRADAAVMLGADYLAEKLPMLTDPFQIAITGYALHVTGHNGKDMAYSMLKAIQRETNFIYWAAEEIPPNPTRIIDTISVSDPREWHHNLENAVMATSYGLLMYLAHNEVREATPIMKWIHSQHMGMVGWSSSVDTLLAIESLTEYALRATNREFYSMEINLWATADPTWQHTVVLNRSNWAQHFSYEMVPAWGQIIARAEGTGYASLSVSNFFKVEHAYLVEDTGPGFDAFEIYLDRMSFTGKNASLISATVCTRWIRPDLGDQSGMMWVEVSIPTGFEVDRDAIYAIHNARVPGLRRAIYDDGSLVILFDHIQQEPTCFDFTAERRYPVANTSIAHLLYAGEYSETALFFPTSYNAFTLFHLHICQVCGSFQCPYCQYYNSAAFLVASRLVLLMLAILFFLSYEIR